MKNRVFPLGVLAISNCHVKNCNGFVLSNDNVEAVHYASSLNFSSEYPSAEGVFLGLFDDGGKPF